MSTEPTGLEPFTPTRIRTTSATERAAFRRCRRQWLLTIVHRLQAPEAQVNFWFGELVHRGLEAYYVCQRAGQPHESRVGNALAAYDEAYQASLAPMQRDLGWLWPKAAQVYGDMGVLGRRVLEGYFEREPRDPLGEEVIQVEQRLWVPIKSPSGRTIGRLSVKADVVVRRRGRLSVVDHKTAGQKMSSAQLDIDDQLTAEVYAVWKATGAFPEEALYNALLKKAPEPPKQIKGTKAEPIKLSQDRNQPTTFRLYVEEIRRLGLTTEAYSAMLAYLKDEEDAGDPKFFYREGVFRTPGQMAQFEANLYHEFRDMRAVALHPERAYPNPSFACPSCPVRDVCLAMMDGSDPSLLIQAGYVVGDPRY